VPDIPNVPDVLPVLSRGKHRNPKRGACFMEMASFLAGERWSDHPSCTHPLLADVARNVNDRTTDAGRPALAPMIPAVIGLTTDDPRADARIALHCALVALPTVSAERQRSLAVGVLSCERMLAGLGDRPDGTLAPRTRQVLADVPEATRWAGRLRLPLRHRPRRDVGAALPPLLGARHREPVRPRDRRDGGAGLRRAAARHAVGAIDECAALEPAALAEPVRVDAAQWREACQLT
jgi:hypothetical protein